MSAMDAMTTGWTVGRQCDVGSVDVPTGTTYAWLIG